METSSGYLHIHYTSMVLCFHHQETSEKCHAAFTRINACREIEAEKDQ